MRYQTQVFVDRKEWRKVEIATVSGNHSTIPATADEHECGPLRCEPFSCDVCTDTVPSCDVSKCQAYGIETYACGACRGERARVEPTV
jgi:hypothetical protein